MPEELKKKTGYPRFASRVTAFVWAELTVGLLFLIPGVVLALNDRFQIGIILMILGVWLQLSIMTWRAISYLVALLIEIAPAMAALIRLLNR